MNAAINPEVVALREQVEANTKELMAQGKEISELRGNILQLDKTVRATAFQSIWQLIALIVSLCVSVIGCLVYQTHMIDKRFEQIDKRFEQIDKRFEQVEKRIDTVERNLNIRFDAFEKNLNARFEDFKQEIRAQRK